MPSRPLLETSKAPDLTGNTNARSHILAPVMLDAVQCNSQSQIDEYYVKDDRIWPHDLEGVTNNLQVN